jgi:hypothetical protein
MSSPSSTESMAERARAYWNVDGLPEILLSLLFLLFGGCFVNDAFFGVLFLGALIPGGLRLPQVLERLKARWTYPRTGYVPAPLSYEEWGEIRRKPLSINPDVSPSVRARRALWLPQYRLRYRLALFGGGAFLLAMDAWPFRWAPLVLSLAAAGAFLYARAHPALLPLRPLVLVSLPLWGFMVSVAEVGTRTRLDWVLIGFGGAGLLSGIVTFWRFVRQHPLPEAQP